MYARIKSLVHILLFHSLIPHINYPPTLQDSSSTGHTFAGKLSKSWEKGTNIFQFLLVLKTLLKNYYSPQNNEKQVILSVSLV